MLHIQSAVTTFIIFTCVQDIVVPLGIELLGVQVETLFGIHLSYMQTDLPNYKAKPNECVLAWIFNNKLGGIK